VDEQQILDHLEPLRAANPNFRAVLYTIPNRFGPVHRAKQRWPWITFGIHGWEHTFCEATSWTDDAARGYLRKALEMGYDPIFKAPNWRYDEELAGACAELGVILHHHESEDPLPTPRLRTYPGPKKMRSYSEPYVSVHTHLQPNPSTDSVLDHPGFTRAAVVGYEKFLLPEDVAIELGPEAK